MNDSLLKFICQIEYLNRNINIEYDVDINENLNLNEIVYLILKKYSLFESVFDIIYDKLNDFVITNRNLMEIDIESSDHYSNISEYWNNLYSKSWIIFQNNIQTFDSLISYCKKFQECLAIKKQNELLGLQIEYHRAIDECHSRMKCEVKTIHDDYSMLYNNKNSDSTKVLNECKDKIKIIKHKWKKIIFDLMNKQKDEFREWINKENTNTSFEKSNILPHMDIPREHINEKRQNFSFKFGHQTKYTHNINICCLPLNYFLSLTLNSDYYYHTILKNNLSLHTNNLTALVVITNGKLSDLNQAEKLIYSSCLLSTEFHFPNIDEQRERIYELIKTNNLSLKEGDFYITIHSNLASAQIIFHLIYNTTEPFIPSPQTNYIIGLTNVIDICFKNSISNIIIPLLTSYELSENMDIKWCIKAADSMLKSLKGIILQTTPFHSKSSPLNFNLILPEKIPDEIFNTLCDLTQKTYTSTNTLNLTNYK